MTRPPTRCRIPNRNDGGERGAKNAAAMAPESVIPEKWHRFQKIMLQQKLKRALVRPEAIAL
jgi:hypothetical protein